MNTLLRLPLFLLVLCLAACQGTLVRNELVGVKQRIDTARQNGAYLCAPRELALAESNYDFAVADLDYGAYFPAREHADQAAKNANLAFEKSPRAYCSYSPTPPPPSDSQTPRPCSSRPRPQPSAGKMAQLRPVPKAISISTVLTARQTIACTYQPIRAPARRRAVASRDASSLTRTVREGRAEA